MKKAAREMVAQHHIDAEADLKELLSYDEDVYDDDYDGMDDFLSLDPHGTDGIASPIEFDDPGSDYDLEYAYDPFLY